MSIVISPASERDSQNVKSMIFDVWQNEFGFKVSAEDALDLNHLEKSYQMPDSLFLVAKNVDEVVGTIAFERLTENSFALKRMFVKKNYRRQGVAQKLIDYLFKEIRILCFNYAPVIYLSTKSDLAQAARSFYLRNGFQVIQKSELPQNFPFFYEDDLYMKKNI